MYRHAIAVVCLCVAFVAEGQSGNSDPQAILLATKSVTALTGGATITDVTMTGNVVSNLDSDNDSGTGTFTAKGTGQSRIDLALSTGGRTEIRDSQTGSPEGQWTSRNHAPKPMTVRNCTTDAAWFFPALTSLHGIPNRLFKYIGQETRNDVPVQHIRSYAFNSALSRTDQSRHEGLTAVDFYLDSDTLLPVALSFSVHPDDGSDIDLPVVVEFSNYQKIRGILVPMRVRKYLQGNLLLDFSVSNVTLNSGLADANFAVRHTKAGE